MKVIKVLVIKHQSKFGYQTCTLYERLYKKKFTLPYELNTTSIILSEHARRRGKLCNPSNATHCTLSIGLNLFKSIELLIHSCSKQVRSDKNPSSPENNLNRRQGKGMIYLNKSLIYLR